MSNFIAIRPPTGSLMCFGCAFIDIRPPTGSLVLVVTSFSTKVSSLQD
ncbi:MAG: hypothetical protein M9916_05780 [Crocinitomicaceae bacterium]|nr:hypothetical protein [Crocinitomicaceae bacterium]